IGNPANAASCLPNTSATSLGLLSYATICSPSSSSSGDNCTSSRLKSEFTIEYPRYRRCCHRAHHLAGSAPTTLASGASSVTSNNNPISISCEPTSDGPVVSTSIKPAGTDCVGGLRP